MDQKVICTRAHVCAEADGCDHSFPHKIEIFDGQYSKGLVKCTDWDNCEDHRVRCIAYGIDFEIEELFLL